jgi:hypothetical protein
LCVFAAFAAVLLCLSPVQANERIGSFLVPDKIHDVIILDGEITSSTPRDFARALKAQPKAKVLILGSPGGLVTAALKLASDVKRRGLNTAIPRQFGCYSACAYVYFAGAEHVVAGELGVHRLSTGSAGDDTSAYFTTVKQELGRFDIPDEVIAWMADTPAGDMHVFSRQEIAALSLNRSSGPKSRTAVLAAR